MPEYEIVRWDAVIPPQNTFPYPMVYIKPDENFLQYAKENQYLFSLQVSGTNSNYDARPVVGMVDSSGFYPNYRPNFFNETGTYVIVLFTNWIGYPPNNGKIQLRGITGPDKIEIRPPTFSVPQPMEFFQSEKPKNKDECRLTSAQLSLVLIVIFLIFCSVLYFSSK